MAFECARDPTTGQPVSLRFNSGDFIRASDDKSLNVFKVAANLGPELSVEDSIKYQVLSEGTAFIGAVEQDNLGEELEEIEPIRFG